MKRNLKVEFLLIGWRFFGVWYRKLKKPNETEPDRNRIIWGGFGFHRYENQNRTELKPNYKIWGGFGLPQSIPRPKPKTPLINLGMTKCPTQQS